MTDGMKKNKESILNKIKDDIIQLNQSLEGSQQFIRYTSDPKEKYRSLNSLNKMLGLIQDRLDEYLFLSEIFQERKIDKDITEIKNYVEEIQGISNLNPQRSTNRQELEQIYKLLENFNDNELNSIGYHLNITQDKLNDKRMNKALQILVEMLQSSRIAELRDLVVLRLRRPEKT